MLYNFDVQRSMFDVSASATRHPSPATYRQSQQVTGLAWALQAPLLV
jgi:hypothetical protein